MKVPPKALAVGYGALTTGLAGLAGLVTQFLTGNPVIALVVTAVVGGVVALIASPRERESQAEVNALKAQVARLGKPESKSDRQRRLMEEQRDLNRMKLPSRYK